jgi:hypothetical protein
MKIHINNTEQLNTFVRNVAKNTKLSPTSLKSAIAKGVGFEHIKPLETALDMSFDANAEQTPSSNKNTLMISHVYIEDVKPNVLRVLIESNDELQFKHRDCAMFFTTDGDHLYASDMDEPSNDLFHDGNFLTTIYDHYLVHDMVVNLLKSLNDVGLKLSLSDQLHNHEMDLEYYEKQVQIAEDIVLENN